MKGLSLVAMIFLVAGCASYEGRGLQDGSSRTADAVRVMGEPALRWTEPDGGETFAYPRGPAGYHTYFLRFDANGVLVSRENVLEPKHFARLREGMTQDEVLRVIGPPFPGWTLYFKARDELVWEWRWCDDFGEAARFNALFDGTSGRLRSTASLTERQAVAFGRGDRRNWCSR